MPRLVPANDQSIAEATRRLRDGAVVVFPTETVYGLGADAFSDTALELIYELKGRPAANPLIAHVLDVNQARRLVTQWDRRCDQLVLKFWPGPLTLVLPKAAAVPDRATGRLKTIAVRAPAHPVARQLLQTFGSPICAPSANVSGFVSPTRAEHVVEDFQRAALGAQDSALSAVMENLLILDGGPCEVGIESTVLDMTHPIPCVLRPGGVTIEQLRDVVGAVEAPTLTEQAGGPGTSPAHYAPQTPAELIDQDALSSRLADARQSMVVLCLDDIAITPPHRAIFMPSDAPSYANRLYDALRQADAMGCQRILIQRPPWRGGLWKAVHDRLNRATATKR